MAEFPSLPLWTDAYLGDTTHLNNAEHGSYLLLLMVAWRSETTDLPDDDRVLAKYARCSTKAWPHMRAILAPFFVVSGGRWTQLRLLEEKNIVSRKRDSAAANGRASALKRKERHSTKRPTERERSDQRIANELSTPTPIPTPIEEEPIPATPIQPAPVGEELDRLVAQCGRVAGVAIWPNRPAHFADQLDEVRGWTTTMGLDPCTEIIPALEHETQNNPGNRHSLKYFTPMMARIAAQKEAKANGHHQTASNGTGRTVAAAIRVFGGDDED